MLTALVASSLLGHQNSSLSLAQAIGHSLQSDLQTPRRRPATPGSAPPQGPGGPPPASQTTPAKEESFDTATKDFEKQEGVVNTFRKGETLLWEIPKKMLGRDFLWMIELKGTPAGGYNGSTAAGDLIRFEQRGDKILVRSIDYSVRASEGKEIKLGVQQSNIQPIITTFDIKSKSKGGGLLVDVSRLFKSELPELRYGPSVGGSAMDPNRSFLEKVSDFPDNVNVEVTATFVGGGGLSFNGFSAFISKPSNTALVHHSITVLPETPMMGRLADSRVGYFSNRFEDYGTPKNGVKDFAFISRYRLEKKDPTAELSEPKKQIVYYIGREVPMKYHSYIKAGVEDWNAAFEEAGFKNAVVCKEAPTEQEDPKWSAEDSRVSVIRWAPLPIANAMGPHLSDPRSGEILSAHIIIWHDVLKLAEDWYFAQASPSDPRAQKLPLSDEVIGECMRFIVSHEFGHTLGLPHNGKSSAMVRTELLRDPKWTAENGTAYSIMDYARFNYVAQPSDHASLVPKVGKYDRFSIMWGYKPIPSASNPSDEKFVLDNWASRQVEDPTLRFYDNFTDVDPTAQSEALGDDAVVASTYGVANLHRVMGFLKPAATKYGEDYSELSRFYGAVWGQYSRYIGHVVTMVGGVVQTDYHAGRGNNVYSPVPRDRQKAAVKWLLDNVMVTPTYLVPKDILYKLGASGIASRVSGSQSRAFAGLLQNARLGRMLENEQVNGPQAYTVAEMMGDIRGEVWKEFADASPKIDLYRRGLQRTYVNALVGKLAGTSSEARAFAISDLRIQLGAIRRAAPRAADLSTAAHLADMDLLISQSLTNPPAQVGTGTSTSFPFGGTNVEDGSDFCQAIYRTGKF